VVSRSKPIPITCLDKPRSLLCSVNAVGRIKQALGENPMEWKAEEWAAILMAAMQGAEPGKFMRVERTWKTGDRIEIEFDMPLVLEAVDAQHPSLVAPVHGPVALFAVGAAPAKVKRAALMGAVQSAAGSADWQVKTDGEPIALRPFAAIKDEKYRLYLEVEG